MHPSPTSMAPPPGYQPPGSQMGPVSPTLLKPPHSHQQRTNTRSLAASALGGEGSPDNPPATRPSCPPQPARLTSLICLPFTPHHGHSGGPVEGPLSGVGGTFRLRGEMGQLPRALGVEPSGPYTQGRGMSQGSGLRGPTATWTGSQ